MKKLALALCLISTVGCASQKYSVDTVSMAWYEKGKYAYDKKTIIKTNHQTGETWRYRCKSNTPCNWEPINTVVRTK